MGVQVLLQGKAIYRSQSRVCRMEWTDANSERESLARTTFHFPGGHTFQGEYPTRRTETIEGTIWQAGADPDAILLGVSLMTRDQVLLNTVHILKPGRATESELDRGLVIKTYPIKRGAARR